MKTNLMVKNMATFIVALPFILLVSCEGETKEEAKTTETTAGTAPALPYVASYSSSFEMGNPSYAAMILQGSWKDWEENKMENMKSWVADTIRAYHSDNMMVEGADSLQARWIRGRAKYSAVLDSVQAVMPVYSTDKKENWVLVWAKEINTALDGSKDTVQLMETWRINKDGKADLLLQYDRANRKK